MEQLLDAKRSQIHVIIKNSAGLKTLRCFFVVLLLSIPVREYFVAICLYCAILLPNGNKT